MRYPVHASRVSITAPIAILDQCDFLENEIVRLRDIGGKGRGPVRKTSHANVSLDNREKAKITASAGASKLPRSRRTPA